MRPIGAALHLALVRRLGGGSVPSVSPPPPTPVADPIPASVPYAMPAGAPYNVPVPCVVPTYDGTGHAFHPSVWDAGAGRTWNGFRYWMAMTPFHGGDEDLENPCVVASQDGFHWEVPRGLVNPLAVRGEFAGFDYNSDTELVFDPDGADTGTLYCYWRPARGFTAPLDEAWYFRTSTDGVTWTRAQQAGAWYGVDIAYASPAIVRLTAHDWRAFTNAGMLTATKPSGPWSPLQRYRHVGLAGRWWWHHDVEWVNGRFWAVVNNGNTDIWAAVSRDGVTWVHGAAILAKPSTNAWESQGYYRPTLLQHPDLTQVRVWYSGYNTEDPDLDRRIGYTHVPNEVWESLPA